MLQLNIGRRVWSNDPRSLAPSPTKLSTLRMSPYTSSSLFTRDTVVKQQDSPSPPYAQSVAYVGGGVRRDPPQYYSSSSQHRALESPTAFSSIPEREHPAHSHSRITTMPLQKRSASDDSNGTPAKHIKTEQPEEFSNAVKKRLQSSSRTGQACDRCKVSASASGIRIDGSKELIVTTDPKNSMRWTSRRMLTMFAEQHRMSDDRSHYGSSHVAGLC